MRCQLIRHKNKTLIFSVLQIGRYSPDFSQTGRCRPSAKECDTGHLRANCRGRNERMQQYEVTQGRMQILHPFQMTLRRVANLHSHTVNFCGLVFLFSAGLPCFTRLKNEPQGVASGRKRRMQQCKGSQKKNANPASFLKDNLQCCTLHLNNFRHMTTDFVI